MKRVSLPSGIDNLRRSGLLAPKEFLFSYQLKVMPETGGFSILVAFVVLCSPKSSIKDFLYDGQF
jgi:hypothetical protein